MKSRVCDNCLRRKRFTPDTWEEIGWTRRSNEEGLRVYWCWTCSGNKPKRKPKAAPLVYFYGKIGTHAMGRYLLVSGSLEMGAMVEWRDDKPGTKPERGIIDHISYPAGAPLYFIARF